VFSDGSFKVPEGTLALPGTLAGQLRCKPVRWMELFLRGSAWERFGDPRVNQLVTRLG